MIYLRLFLTFLKIGAFTFGGGYAMIPIVRDAVITNGWLTSDEFLDFLAVSESTPGPLAVNMATFVGSETGGFLGSLLATLGVVLPSLIIILLIAAVINNLLKFAGVNAFLSGVRPCVTALVLSAAVLLAGEAFLNVTTVKDKINPDYKAIIIFAFTAAISLICKKIFKKEISPILLIVISAAAGILIYGVF